MPKLRSSARRSYVSCRKHSHCSGITTTQCRHRKGCRMTKEKNGRSIVRQITVRVQDTINVLKHRRH